MAIIGFPRACLQPRIGVNSPRHHVSSQSFHFILQISRLLVARGSRYVAEWFIVNCSFVPVADYSSCIQTCNRYMYLTISIFQVYGLVLMYEYSIYNKLCCNFNVSNPKLTHMLNILNKLV